MQFSTGAKIENACHVCRGPGPTWQSSEPTPGASSKNRGAMALRLELGEGLLGIEVPGSDFCAQDFWGFFYGIFSSNPTAIFKQGGSFLYCFLLGYLLRICGGGIVSEFYSI